MRLMPKILRSPVGGRSNPCELAACYLHNSIRVAQNLSRRNSHAQIKLGDMPSLNNRVRLTYGHRNPLKMFQTANLQSAHNTHNSLRIFQDGNSRLAQNLRVSFMPAQTNRVRNTYSVRNLLNCLDYNESLESASLLIAQKRTLNILLEVPTNNVESCDNRVTISHAVLRHKENQQHPVLDNGNRLSLSEPVNLPTDSRQLPGVPKNKPSLRGPVRYLCGTQSPSQNKPEIIGAVNQVNNIYLVQLSGSDRAFLRCRRLISPSIDVMMNCEVLSPVSFTLSIASTISCGTRDFSDCDFAFTVPVAITEPCEYWWATVYPKENQNKALTWATLNNKVGHTKFIFGLQGNASVCGNTVEASNHNVIGANTMAYQHSTQTRPKFQYRFLALNRSDMSAKPCRVSVEASTEHDARMVLAPYFILSLAARLPAQGVCNA